MSHTTSCLVSGEGLVHDPDELKESEPPNAGVIGRLWFCFGGAKKVSASAGAPNVRDHRRKVVV